MTSVQGEVEVKKFYVFIFPILVLIIITIINLLRLIFHLKEKLAFFIFAQLGAIFDVMVTTAVETTIGRAFLCLLLLLFMF